MTMNYERLEEIVELNSGDVRNMDDYAEFATEIRRLRGLLGELFAACKMAAEVERERTTLRDRNGVVVSTGVPSRLLAQLESALASVERSKLQL